jgi:hypothetical protein
MKPEDLKQWLVSTVGSACPLVVIWSFRKAQAKS